MTHSRDSRIVKNASERKLSKLVQNLADEYKETFETYLKTKKISDEDLESWHTTISSKVFVKYESDNLARKFPGKLDKLKKKVQSSFETLKRFAKRLKEQKENSERRTLLQLETNFILDVRKSISKKTLKYTEEHELREYCEMERKNAVVRHEIELMKLEYPTGDEKEEFAKKIEEEVKYFTDKNAEKKDLILQFLDAGYKQINLHYTKTINLLLEGGWMDEKDLREEHDMIVKRLIEKEINRFNDERLPRAMAQDHLQRIKKSLEDEYDNTKSWNEAKYSLLGHFVKIVKKNAKQILYLIAKVLSGQVP